MSRTAGDLIDGGRRIVRAADALGALSKKGKTALDGMADSLGGLSQKAVKNADMLGDVKYADDVAEAASDVGKRLDKANSYISKIEDLFDPYGGIK